MALPGETAALLARILDKSGTNHAQRFHALNEAIRDYLARDALAPAGDIPAVG